MTDPIDDDRVPHWLERFKQINARGIPLKVEAFLQTGDPFYALRALQAALLAEQAVPLPIAEWLLKGIQLSMPLIDDQRHADRVPLGVALGIEGGAGKANVPRAYRERKVREHRLAEMRALWRVGATVREAAILVASHHEPPLNIDTLSAMWKRERQRPIRPDQSSRLWERGGKATFEAVRQLLAQYPDNDQTKEAKAAIAARLNVDG